MKKLIYLFIPALLLFGKAHAQAVYSPPLSEGHIISPQYSFFNENCTQVLTVGLADAILWDIATEKPVQRINFAAFIKQYDPTDERWSLKAVPSPDLTKLIVLLTPKGGNEQAFLFDIRAGKLSPDDAVFNDKIYGFSAKGDYVAMAHMREAGKSPSWYVQTCPPPEGSKVIITVQGIKNFAPVGFSLDGKTYYGKNTENKRFILYDPLTGKSENTGLKYNDKTKYYFYYTDYLFYTSKWIKRPPTGDDWRNAYYNTETKDIVKWTDKDGITGPYTFSDDGKYGMYFETNKLYQFVIRDMKTGKDFARMNQTDQSSRYTYARMPQGNTKFFVMSNDPGKILVYDINKPDPVKSFSIMAGESTVAMAKNALNSEFGIRKIEEDAKADYDFKNFMINFADIDHFYFNLTNAQSLKGRDIISLPFTKNHYLNSLSADTKVKDILALGKIGNCGAGSLILFVVRTIRNGEDRTIFFVDHLDEKGNSIKLQDVGIMAKKTAGGPFLATIDLGVYVANNKTAIVIDQRYPKAPKSNFKKTLMFDHGVCQVYEKK
ncbi:hypothetical protein FW774_15855 [Pedobacter sp. BS3]|uniref:hypothetical protein n=1 Tax=Pedobacter sp. BS3 TaxID=2567937 RepID=UPI0011EF2FD9|nr:hypothetical protein [Pedobacter sp. BS3]TZF82164.1 hypothetical protein FW774_15855 [Pedobacter sp. BS3]